MLQELHGVLTGRVPAYGRHPRWSKRVTNAKPRIIPDRLRVCHSLAPSPSAKRWRDRTPADRKVSSAPSARGSLRALREI